MTSIAESTERGKGTWLRVLLLIAFLSLLSFQLPLPWGGLWLVVPISVAAALLLSWRWGAWGVTVPVGLFALALLVGGPLSLWVWWIPVAALTGAWMGLREEGGGRGIGDLAWTLLPVLLLAAALPWMIEYHKLVTVVDHYLHDSNDRFLAMLTHLEDSGNHVQTLRETWIQGAELQRRALPKLLPTVLFGWMMVLVVLGRGLAGRLARLLRWPDLSRGRFADWRLPDAAIWVLIVGLGLLIAPLPDWRPTAWTLLIGAGLGYCAQGIAVVESFLLARGVPPSMIVLTFVFVSAMATPVFLLASVCLGASDLWLDFRQLEAAPEGD